MCDAIGLLFDPQTAVDDQCKDTLDVVRIQVMMTRKHEIEFVERDRPALPAPADQIENRASDLVWQIGHPRRNRAARIIFKALAYCGALSGPRRPSHAECFSICSAQDNSVSSSPRRPAPAVQFSLVDG
jgi:hypothetical protein